MSGRIQIVEGAHGGGSGEGASKKAQPSGLSLQGVDNGANLLSHYLQELGNRPSHRRVDVISERYKRGDLDLVFKLNAYGADTEYDVIFTPLDVFNELEARARGEADLFQAGVRGDAALNQQSVLCLLANTVQCPNQVSVPSFVRLELPQERYDFRWKDVPVSRPRSNKLRVKLRARPGITARTEAAGFLLGRWGYSVLE